MKPFKTVSASGALILTIVGEHDISTIAKLEADVGAAVDGQPRVVFDLSDVAYIDSMFIAMLVRLHRDIGDRLQLVVPSKSRIRRLFTITGLNEVMPIHESVLEADSSRS